MSNKEAQQLYTGMHVNLQSHESTQHERKVQKPAVLNFTRQAMLT